MMRSRTISVKRVLIGVTAALVIAAGVWWGVRPIQQRWLLQTCVGGDIEDVRFLLLTGVDADARSARGITPLMQTAGWSNPFLMGVVEPDRSPVLADLRTEVYDNYPRLLSFFWSTEPR